MKLRAKASIAAVIAAALAMSGSMAANATIEYPGGGKWWYGVYEPANTTYVYSDYYHPTKKHRSSVQVHNGTIYRSTDAKAGATSKVERSTSYGGNKAYWFAY